MEPTHEDPEQDTLRRERASRLHEAAALVHERAATLQLRHAEDMRGIGDFTRAKRADELAEQEWELAETELRRAGDARARRW